MIKFLTMTALLCAMSAYSAGNGSFYTSEGGHFNITIPTGWSQMPSAGQPASAKKVYGLDLLAAAQTNTPAPSITVKFFAKGNTLFKTPDIYVQLNSRPIGAPEKGERYSKVMYTRVAGRKAYRFERKHFAYDRPSTVRPEKTLMFERHLVVPAGNGFYLLMFSSPFSRAKILLPQFETVLASFRPKHK